MASSKQQYTVVGTPLDLLDINIEYFDRSEINVLFNDVVSPVGTLWSWSGSSDKRILFTPAVAIGVTVTVKRVTGITKLRHSYTNGAAFTAKTLDEDLVQVLHIAQEATESNLSGDFFFDVDMHGFKINNLGGGTASSDVATFGQLTTKSAELAASTGSSLIGFIQSGAGAILRTLQSKVREIELSVKDYGAVCNGITDDTVSINAAITACYNLGGGVVTIPKGGICLVNSANIDIPSNVHLRGAINKPGFPYPYNTNLSTVPNSIRLNPAYSIRLASGAHDSASLTNLFVISTTVNLANWATCNADFTGTAVTVGNSVANGHGQDCSTNNLSIIGFAQAIRAYNCNGYTYHNIRGDNLNGIWISDVTDITRGLGGNHFFPYISVGHGGTGIQNWRSGIGFNLDYQGAYLSDSFCFGYTKGFRVCRDTSVLTNCWADANSTSTVEAEALYGESYGFIAEDAGGGAVNPFTSATLVGCGASSHSVNYKANFTDMATQGATLRLIGCDGWGSTGKHHALIDHGRILINNCNFYNLTSIAAFGTTSNTSYYQVSDTTFDGVGAAYSINPASALKGTIGLGNKLINGTSGINTYEQINPEYDTHTYTVSGSTSGFKQQAQLSNGTASAPTVVSNGNTLWAMSGLGYTGADFSVCTRTRYAVDDPTPSPTSMGGSIIWATQLAGSVAGPVEHIVLKNTGNLQPIGNATKSLGASGARWAAVWSQLFNTPGGTVPIMTSEVTLSSGAGVAVGTLTNAPVAGNPTKWIKIDDAGVTRYIPVW